jgi:hypothetical protein
MLDSWVFEVDGRTFRATVERDDHMEAPWDEHDGHGDVSDWTTRNKRPGEWIIASDGRNKRFYDFAGAVKKARAEGWDAPPYKTGTRREQAARAALRDFEHLKAWCDDEWFWVGVIVTPLCDCCDSPDGNAAESLWGIESSDESYLKEVALELAGQIAPARAAA